MSDFSGIFYQSVDSPEACHERELPTDILKFSCGNTLCPVRMWSRNSQCVQSINTIKLFESASPSTHYWHSKDMAWWFSAARQVFYDIQALLKKPDLKATPFTLSRTSRLLHDPENARITWLSCIVQFFLGREGTVLHPARAMIRTPGDDDGLPDTLRFDKFLLECWSRMDLNSEEETALVRTIENLQAKFDTRWKVCIAAYQRHVYRVQNRGPQDENRIFLPRPRAYERIRSSLTPIQAQTGCRIDVPWDEEDEVIEITGPEEGVERARQLILETWRENLVGVGAGSDLSLTRSQYLTAARTLWRLGRAASQVSAGVETDSEEVGLACAAARDQLFSAQVDLQMMAYRALQADDEQAWVVLRAFGQIFWWYRGRHARDS